MTSADHRRPRLRWGVAGGGRRGVLRRADSEAAEGCSVPHGGGGGTLHLHGRGWHRRRVVGWCSMGDEVATGADDGAASIGVGG